MAIEDVIKIKDQATPALDNIIGHINSLGNILMRTTGKLNQMTNQFHAISLAAQKPVKPIKEVSEETKKAKEEAKKLKEQQRAVTQGFNNWQKSIITVSHALNIVKSTLGSLGLLNFDRAFERMDTMEKFEQRLTRIAGSADVSKYLVGEIDKTVRGTAYSIDYAMQAIQNLITREVGIGPSMDIVATLQDAVAFYGKGTDQELVAAASAVGKILSKGTVDMRQLDVLSNLGINAVQIYAQATQQSSSVVQHALTRNMLKSSEFITTLTEAMNDGRNGVISVANAAKESGKIWTTVFANMRAAGARGIIDIIQKVDEAVKLLGGAGIKELFVEIGKMAEKTFKSIGTMILNTFKVFAPLFKIVMLVARAFSFLISKITIMPNIVVGLSVALGILMAVVIGTKVATIGLTAAFGALASAMAVIPGVNIVLGISVAIGVLVGLLYSAVSKFGSFSNAVKVLLGEIKILGLGFAFAMQAIMINSISMFNYVLAYVKYALKGLAGALVDLFGIAFDAITNPLMSVLKMLNLAIEQINKLKPGKKIATFDLPETLGDKARKAVHNKLNTGETLAQATEGARQKGLRNNEKLERLSQPYIDALRQQNQLKAGIEASKIPKDNFDINKHLDMINKKGVTLMGGTVDNLKKISGDVSITEDDIRLLRDIARSKYINQNNTYRPEMRIEFSGDIHETTDINKVMGAIEDMVGKAYDSSLVGI